MRMLRLAAFAAVLVAGLAVPAAAQEAHVAIATAQVSVGTTATKVADTRPTRSAVSITNIGTTDAYCGASSVTTSTGTLLPGVAGASLTIPTNAPVYCIVATGTQTVTVLESY